MTKQNQDVDNYFAGDDLVLDFTTRDNDSGSVKDLTGASIEWVMAPRQGGTATLTKTTSGGGISITDASNGEFQVTIAPADTQDLEEREYYHEAEVTDTNGNTATVATGTVDLVADTT